MDQPLLGGSQSGQQSGQPSPDDGSFEFNPAELWSLVKRHWLTIVAGGLLGLGWGLLQFYNTPATYQATTQVQIERRMPSPLGGQNTWMQAIWNPEFYPTQYEILKGSGLAMKVVEHLRLWAVPEFEATVARSSSSDALGNTAADDEEMKQRLAASILGGVEIRPVRGTQLVNISYRARSGRVAAMLANGYAEAFSIQSSDKQASVANSLSTRIVNEIAAAEEKISADEEQLYELADRSGLLAPDADSEVQDSRVGAANNQLLTAEQARIAAQAEYNSKRNQPEMALAEITSPAEFDVARSKLNELEAEYESKKNVYLDSSQVMIQLNQNLDNERRRFQAATSALATRTINEARSQYEQAQRAEQTLRNRYNNLRRSARAAQADVSESDDLRDSIELQKQTLAQLRQTQQSLGVSTRGGESAIRQVQVAHAPQRPISPQLRSELTAGIGLGLILAASLVVLFELLDRTIKSPGELERRLNLPVLAAIPDISAKRGYGRYGYGYGYGYGRNRSKKPAKKRAKSESEPSIDLIPYRRPRIAVSEAYRGLRTNLLLSTADELRVVAVTSSFPSEGKTATTTNLATVLAQLGKKTLVLDGDLRKARIHEVLKISNRSGLVNYLVGAQPIENVVLPTQVDNLFAAPAGPTPPNPSELLASARMEHFLAEAKKAFDFVLIDTPPVLAVTDATILGAHADGLIITCRAGRVTRDELRSCRDRLSLGGVKILGAVLNCFRPHAGRGERGYSTYHYETYGLSDDDDISTDSMDRRGEVA